MGEERIPAHTGRDGQAAGDFPGVLHIHPEDVLMLIGIRRPRLRETAGRSQEKIGILKPAELAAESESAIGAEIVYRSRFQIDEQKTEGDLMRAPGHRDIVRGLPGQYTAGKKA